LPGEIGNVQAGEKKASAVSREEKIPKNLCAKLPLRGSSSVINCRQIDHEIHEAQESGQ
jgi:hypothetical protein